MKSNQLDTAYQAYLHGETTYARKLVAQLLVADSHNERAWLLLARLVDDRERVIDCLERALKINPANPATISALQVLKQLNPSPAEPVPAHAETTLAVAGILAREVIHPVTTHPGPGIIPFSLPETSVETLRPPGRKQNLPLILGGSWS